MSQIDFDFLGEHHYDQDRHTRDSVTMLSAYEIEGLRTALEHRAAHAQSVAEAADATKLLEAVDTLADLVGRFVRLRAVLKESRASDGDPISVAVLHRRGLVTLELCGKLDNALRSHPREQCYTRQQSKRLEDDLTRSDH